MSFPGQARTVYDWLETHPKQVIRFTDAQGAQLHCEPMAPTVRNDTIFDWIEANLRPLRPPALTGQHLSSPQACLRRRRNQRLV